MQKGEFDLERREIDLRRGEFGLQKGEFGFQELIWLAKTICVTYYLLYKMKLLIRLQKFKFSMLEFVLWQCKKCKKFIFFIFLP